MRKSCGRAPGLVVAWLCIKLRVYTHVVFTARVWWISREFLDNLLTIFTPSFTQRGNSFLICLGRGFTHYPQALIKVSTKETNI